MKPVLLIFPGKKTSQPIMPLSVLALAAYLREHGMDVEVLDTRLNDYEDVDFSRYLLVGLSVTFGERVRVAYEISKYIKKKLPQMIIVWGGQLPSFSPEVVCGSGLVDIVVRNEGEETLLKLAKCLSTGKSLDKVRGVTLKKNGKIISNPDRPFLDMNALPLPAYDLIDVKQYTEQKDGSNRISMETSRGCPHNCTYCFSPQMYKCTWRAKNAGNVVKEIKQLISRFSVNNFFFWDSNFFVDKKRVLGICKNIRKSGIKIRWSAYARADYISKYTDNEMLLMKQGGLCFLSLGAESGSQHILDSLNKNLKVDDIKIAVSKCAKHGIGCSFSFMVGMPNETFDDIKQTIRFCDELEKINPSVEIKEYKVFELIPGNKLYYEHYNERFKNLEEFVSYDTGDYTRLKWLSPAEIRRLQVLSSITAFLYMRRLFNNRRHGFKKTIFGSSVNLLLWNIFSTLVYADALLRWKTYFFSLGYEWRLFGYVGRRIMSREVGQF